MFHKLFSLNPKFQNWWHNLRSGLTVAPLCKGMPVSLAELAQ